MCRQIDQEFSVSKVVQFLVLADILPGGIHSFNDPMNTIQNHYVVPRVYR